jgi:hypothetical protein
VVWPWYTRRLSQIIWLQVREERRGKKRILPEFCDVLDSFIQIWQIQIFSSKYDHLGSISPHCMIRTALSFLWQWKNWPQKETLRVQMYRQTSGWRVQRCSQVRSAITILNVSQSPMQRLGCRKVAIADSASSKISEEYVANKLLHLLHWSLHFCLKSIGKAAS